MKSVNLNFLEPSGPLQACNWTALPLHLQEGNGIFFLLAVEVHGDMQKDEVRSTSVCLSYEAHTADRGGAYSVLMEET